MASKNLVESIEQLNEVLKATPNSLVEFRQGIIVALETLLHKNKIYGGFSYLTAENSYPLNSVGIHYVNGEPVFENTDYTRRKYMVKTSKRKS